jgi:hypothetical protein
MKMQIHKNYAALQNYSDPTPVPASTSKPKQISPGFSGSMLGRIHSAKAGCGGCGRK